MRPSDGYQNDLRLVIVALISLDFSAGWEFQAVPAEPKIAELAPSVDELTSYDREHAVAYTRLLDADADKADWREIARIVLGLDPTVEPDRARRTFESHLTRAKWLAGHGYRDLLRSGWPKQ